MEKKLIELIFVFANKFKITVLVIYGMTQTLKNDQP